MPPPRWTTPEQLSFLTGWVEKYLEAKKKKQYDNFWKELECAWFEKWPEDGLGEECDLASPEGVKRFAEVAAKVELQKDQLKTWFRNNSGDKGRRALNKKPVICVGVKPHGKRRLRAEEMYSRLVYANQIQSAVSEQIRTLKPGRKGLLPLIRTQIKKAWEAESDEVKAMVLEAVANQDVPTKEKVIEKTPEAYAKVIKELPTIFSQFFGELADMTGWSFEVVCGGPNPSNSGKVRTMGYHEGKNRLGLFFSEAYPSYEKGFLTPYKDFLNDVYPAAVCNARALKSVDGDGVNEGDEDDFEVEGEDEDGIGGVGGGDGIDDDDDPPPSSDSEDPPGWWTRISVGASGEPASSTGAQSGQLDGEQSVEGQDLSFEGLHRMPSTPRSPTLNPSTPRSSNFHSPTPQASRQNTPTPDLSGTNQALTTHIPRHVWSDELIDPQLRDTRLSPPPPDHHQAITGGNAQAEPETENPGGNAASGASAGVTSGLTAPGSGPLPQCPPAPTTLEAETGDAGARMSPPTKKGPNPRTKIPASAAAEVDLSGGRGQRKRKKTGPKEVEPLTARSAQKNTPEAAGARDSVTTGRKAPKRKGLDGAAGALKKKAKK
ncbi:hypothetical protein BD779DRAFT_1672737 [Infundibulicybe gibba]|nr:hypothetical protein BD779DRAFT_1672737 [Infundibulicybe gibba]